MLCGTGNILQNIPHIQFERGEYFPEYLPIPQNIVMDLNDVMFWITLVVQLPQDPNPPHGWIAVAMQCPGRFLRHNRSKS
jgi:hypothetical protein